MAEFIDDVMREAREAGGVEALRSRLSECLATRNRHSWRELRTNVEQDASYCEHCLIVSLNNVEFWPVEPER